MILKTILEGLGLGALGMAVIAAILSGIMTLEGKTLSTSQLTLPERDETKA